MSEDEREEFNLVLWFDDGTYHYVERNVSARAAITGAQGCIRVARGDPYLSVVAKIMVTDGGDSTVFLWEKGKGIVWPEPSDIPNVDNERLK